MLQRLDLKKILVNSAIAIFFIAIIVTTQFGGMFVSMIWYASLAFSVVVALYSCDMMVPKYQIVFMILVFVTGIMNTYLIGTSSLRNQALLVFFFIVSLLFFSEEVNEQVYLFAVFANALVVVYKYITVGFRAEIYTNATTNFVSVYLLYPLVLYYITLERRRKAMPLYPVALVWILSLLSRGRGGIIATSLLFIGILIISFKKLEPRYKVFITYFGIIAAIVMILSINIIIIKMESSVITEYFRSRGLTSVRTKIWSDYLGHCASSTKELLLGVKISEAVAGISYNGNPHNTLMNIHMNNGIFILLMVLGFLGRAFKNGVKAHCPVFCLCLVSIMFRSFTDFVFWPAYGTPVLFFLMFYDFGYKQTRVSQVPKAEINSKLAQDPL